MMNRKTIEPIAIAMTIGALLWLVSSLSTGKREPWDASGYWAVAYPAAIVACAALGYTYPARAWLWPFILFEAQFLAMILRNGELGNLWPLGMALFAIIAVPGVVAATVASRLSSRSVERSG